MQNMKRASADPLGASDMLSFRTFQCENYISMQVEEFARVSWA